MDTLCFSLWEEIVYLYYSKKDTKINIFFIFFRNKLNNGVYIGIETHIMRQRMKKDFRTEPKNVITYNVKITCDDDSFDSAISTMRIHNMMWNDVSEFLFDNYQETQKISGLKNTHNELYYKLREKYPESPSQVVIKAEQHAISSLQSIRSNNNLWSLKTSPIKKKLSIQLDKRIFRMTSNNEFSMTTIDGRKKYNLELYSKFNELFSKYKMCDPKIFEKNNQLWLSVSFELPTPTVVEQSCIGVDLGIKRFATISTGKSISVKKFSAKKRTSRYKKRQLQKHKNSSSAKRKTKKLNGKQTNQNKQMCYEIANDILKEKADIVVLEDLSGIKLKKKGKMRKSFNNRNSQVPYYMFKQILSYKALSVGKRVETVNPYMTSQDDYRGVKKGKRKGCRYYASDGKVFDADFNAAINIAQRYSDVNNKLPVSFKEPLDGTLDFSGRLCQPANREALA